MLGQTRRIHFVGIGGIGMSGIAELLLRTRLRGERLGRAAVGGDRAAGVARASRFTTGHDAANVGDADVVVVSSAVRPTTRRSSRRGDAAIPVIPRAEMLAELMRCGSRSRSPARTARRRRRR